MAPLTVSRLTKELKAFLRPLFMPFGQLHVHAAFLTAVAAVTEPRALEPSHVPSRTRKKGACSRHATPAPAMQWNPLFGFTDRKFLSSASTPRSSGASDSRSYGPPKHQGSVPTAGTEGGWNALRLEPCSHPVERNWEGDAPSVTWHWALWTALCIVREVPKKNQERLRDLN